MSRQCVITRYSVSIAALLLFMTAFGGTTQRQSSNRDARTLSYIGWISEAFGVPLVPQGGPDTEQKARGKCGWNDSIKNSLVLARITYFRADGTMGRSGTAVIFRRYPDRLRVEVQAPGANTIEGFDGNDAWKAGTETLPNAEARDIRSWLRIWPDRLFVTRGGGSAYREVGKHLDAPGPAASGGQDHGSPRNPAVLTAVEIVDTIGPGIGLGGNAKPDTRRVYYSVGEADSLVSAVRWLEPDDPANSPDDRSIPTMEMRAEFADWKTIDGVMWPMQITHWAGGKMDFRLDVVDVKVNQQMPDTLFKAPK